MGGKRRVAWARWAAMLALALLLTLPGACASLTAPDGPDDGQAGELAALRQRLAAQETRVAALQGQNNALQTAVARLGQAPTPTPVAPVAALPTPLPPVRGLAVGGAGKGPATAKVTITEYTDYL